MRLSKAWIIAARDFKIFRRVKNVWSSIIIFPVVISVLFPVILEYLEVRGSHGLAAPGVLPNLLTLLFLLFSYRSSVRSLRDCLLQYSGGESGEKPGTASSHAPY